MYKGGRLAFSLGPVPCFLAVNAVAVLLPYHSLEMSLASIKMPQYLSALQTGSKTLIGAKTLNFLDYLETRSCGDQRFKEFEEMDEIGLSTLLLFKGDLPESSRARV